MFLSIIIPIYNKSAYLPDCMQSVLKQNIPPEQYEIICVDDGSTDDSLQVLEQYAAQNSNVHVFSKKNGGVSSARNLGLKYAAGDYVWFIDPDDFIAPNCLSTILKKCCEENCEWLVVGSYQFTDDAKAWMTMASAANDLKPDPLNHGSACTKVIKRNLITKKQVVFDECMTYAEDALFLYELGYKPGMPYRLQTVLLLQIEFSVGNKQLLNVIDYCTCGFLYSFGVYYRL